MNYALKYAEQGFAVFPVHEPERYPGGFQCSCRKEGCRGKHPRTINGVKDATIDANQLKEWWTKWPNASIGMATGAKSGVSVVDLDGLEGIASGQKLKLSSVITSLTGNGKQLFYADSEGKLSNSVRKLSAGMDTRGTGGYIILPPSIHPSGKTYRWESGSLKREALSPLPEFFASAAVAGNIETISRKPDGWIAEALKGMKNGNIDNTLTSVLGRMRRDNYSMDDALILLRPHALSAGAEKGHLESKIEHVWKAYPSVTNGQSTKAETIDEFLQDQKEVKWICKPIIAEQSIGFVAGLPETCKTWMMIDLAVESARDCGNWLGIFGVAQNRVLFIDQERFRGETQRRFNAVIAAKNLKRSDLVGNLFLKCGTTIKLDAENSFQAFRTELLELRPALVIVDSFATFHGSTETDRTSIQKVLDRIKALRDEIGCAFWFINHESKMVFGQIEEGKAPNPYTMLGSVAIVAASESMLIVRKIEDGHSVVHHVKSTLGTANKSFTVALTDMDNGGILVKGSI